MINYQCFEKLAMSGDSPKSESVRMYFVKLREFAIGYTVKGSALPGLSKVVKTMNARIIGRNLLTFTKYSGYDPEVGSIRSPFDDTGSYPNYRNVAFSLSFDF